jgi:hypothetical protein
MPTLEGGADVPLLGRSATCRPRWRMRRDVFLAMYAPLEGYNLQVPKLQHYYGRKGAGPFSFSLP